MATQRIDKLLASTGRWSRQEAKALIKAGRVLVDGIPAGRGEQKADPSVSRILVDGADLGWQAHTYVMLNKPAGVLTATEDLRRRGLFPVGRLDKDTEGLLLLTDDGELAHRLLSPKKHVDKVYYARLDQPLAPADCAAFAEGVVLADGARCRPALLQLLGDGREALITLREGKFHQVKRMTASRGAAVLWTRP